MIRNKTNSVRLEQYEGGLQIKQGDTASVFGYKLLDENNKPIPTLDGHTAKVRLVKGKRPPKIVYETETIVKDGKVEFTISQALPVCTLWVEINAGGYVFPSDYSVKIEIVQSAEEYEIETLAKKGLEDEIDLLHEIAQKIDDLDINTNASNGYRHVQTLASNEWYVMHNLGYKPVVDVIDSANNVVTGEITHNNENSLTIKFTASFTGEAVLK